ncbi:MAG: MOSC domain-containing protein [Bacteroidota bacterium]
MQLISINIADERTIHRKDRDEKTGIFKMPTDRPVRVNKLGLEQDVIVSKKHHGGPDQAVYVYGTPDYDWWSEELGREITPGTFGENLTISGLESATFNIGDLLHVGEIALQVTAPRIPCGTFAARMEVPNWVKKFRQTERPGLYCRVMKEGVIKVGDPVSMKSYEEETISILEMYRDYYVKDKSRETLLRHLKAPIAIRARKDIEKELQNLASR